MVEMGLITPSRSGLNVYVVNSIAKEMPILETFKGCGAFLISDIIPRRLADCRAVVPPVGGWSDPRFFAKPCLATARLITVWGCL